MIRPCMDDDFAAIETIINEAARAYRGAIPADCWHEPYMTGSDLKAEIAAGVNFWGWDESGALIGVMGLQKVRGATLIRHAYVRSAHQRRGVGGALLNALAGQAAGPLLVGTWDATEWAIRFLPATWLSPGLSGREGSTSQHLLEHSFAPAADFGGSGIWPVRVTRE